MHLCLCVCVYALISYSSCCVPSRGLTFWKNNKWSLHPLFFFSPRVGNSLVSEGRVEEESRECWWSFLFLLHSILLSTSTLASFYLRPWPFTAHPAPPLLLASLIPPLLFHLPSSLSLHPRNSRRGSRRAHPPCFPALPSNLVSAAGETPRISIIWKWMSKSGIGINVCASLKLLWAAAAKSIRQRRRGVRGAQRTTRAGRCLCVILSVNQGNFI